MPKVAVVIGSDSDFDVVQKSLTTLDKFGVDYDAMVISAHRNPEKIFKFASEAEADGYEVIVTAAGKAAHLAGVRLLLESFIVNCCSQKNMQMHQVASLK